MVYLLRLVDPMCRRDNESKDPAGAGNNAMIAKDAEGAGWWAQYRILCSRSLVSRRFEALSPQDISLFLTIGTLTGDFNRS